MRANEEGLAWLEKYACGESAVPPDPNGRDARRSIVKLFVFAYTSAFHWKQSKKPSGSWR